MCCKGCKSVFYCCERHRQWHFQDHNEGCLEIQAAKANLEEAECAFVHQEDCPEYRDLKGMLAGIENGKAPGLEHKCFCTTFCARIMMARFSLISAYHNINTHRGVVNACNVAIATQFLGRCDPMSIRCVTTNLMLRVGSKQNAYDFIKFWLVNGDQYDCHAKQPVPFLTIRNSDAFEPPQGLLKAFEMVSVSPPVSFLIPLALVKLKLLIDIKNMHKLQILRGNLPFDIVHMIKQYFHSTDIMDKRHDIDRIDTFHGYEKVIDGLENDLDFLFETCGKAFGGKYIVWRCFFEQDLEQQAQKYPKEVKTIYNYSCDAWMETPGAYEWILKKLAIVCQREQNRKKAAAQVNALQNPACPTLDNTGTSSDTETVTRAEAKKKNKRRARRSVKKIIKYRSKGNRNTSFAADESGEETDTSFDSDYPDEEDFDSFVEDMGWIIDGGSNSFMDSVYYELDSDF
ncbi:hypothetical protein TWF730_009810 [Orbilia blumenaviensis]|uniref:MYND-type domain-containing protein n=1 Tax=Orbilia blumenaviensis TaxID=1796055 RepID=A0AAV9USU4_9PEZI